MKLTFCGATGTVTGSKYLLELDGRRLLVDCGLFQGYKQLRLRNWASPPFDPSSIEAVVLTHAHIDHSGYLPLLVRSGFAGRVYCSRATAELLEILLPDAAHLQEEEARYANRHAYSKHHPALPLYTQADAQRALGQVHAIDHGRDIPLGEGARFRLIPNGHILGSACVRVEAQGQSVTFSGDLGRPHDLIMRAPADIPATDNLILESTYGNRRHPDTDIPALLADIINRTAARGGVLVIPAFAVGRAQSILYYVHLLKLQRRIGDIPVFLNSPMARDVTSLYRGHLDEMRLSAEEVAAMSGSARFVNSPDESRQLNERSGPMIIISASGMATGGRVLYHLQKFAPDPRNTIAFAGFQAGGTRGASMLAGEKAVKIHGEYVPVNAEVCQLDSLSAHADYAEIIDWLRRLASSPKRVFITHGEPAAADALRRRIEETLGWKVIVPDYLDAVCLS